MGMVLKDKYDQLTTMEQVVFDYIRDNRGCYHRDIVGNTAYGDNQIGGVIVGLIHYGLIVRAYPSPCTYWPTVKGDEL